MTVEDAIVTRLQSLPALAALVGDRIYQLKLPESVPMPAVRVQLISDPRTLHLRGPARAQPARVQVDAYAAEASGGDPYATVQEVAAAIDGDGRGDQASGLCGWRGTIGSPPMIQILGIARDGRLVDYEAEERGLVRMHQDYLVWVRDEP